MITSEKLAAFRALVGPMMAFLGESFNPHTKVLIEDNRAEIVEGLASCHLFTDSAGTSRPGPLRVQIQTPDRIAARIETMPGTPGAGVQLPPSKDSDTATGPAEYTSPKFCALLEAAARIEAHRKANPIAQSCVARIIEETIHDAGFLIIPRKPGYYIDPPLTGDPFTTFEAVKSVLAERARQDAKFGEQNLDPFHFLSVVAEEFGEASQAALHEVHGGKAKGTLRTEVLHLAAVALSMLECLDRGRWAWPIGDAAAKLEAMQAEMVAAQKAADEARRNAAEAVGKAEAELSRVELIASRLFNAAAEKMEVGSLGGIESKLSKLPASCVESRLLEAMSGFCHSRWDGKKHPEAAAVFIVGKALSFNADAWEFQGAFTDEKAAVDACVNARFFVGPAKLGERLPVQPTAWPGAYYPRQTADEASGPVS